MPGSKVELAGDRGGIVFSLESGSFPFRAVDEAVQEVAFVVGGELELPAAECEDAVADSIGHRIENGDAIGEARQLFERLRRFEQFSSLVVDRKDIRAGPRFNFDARVSLVDLVDSPAGVGVLKHGDVGRESRRGQQQQEQRKEFDQSVHRSPQKFPNARVSRFDAILSHHQANCKTIPILPPFGRVYKLDSR